MNADDVNEHDGGRSSDSRRSLQSTLDAYHEAQFANARTLYGLHRGSVAASRLIWDHVSIDYPNGAERAYRDALKLFSAVDAVTEAERPAPGVTGQDSYADQHTTLTSRTGQVIRVPRSLVVFEDQCHQ